MSLGLIGTGADAGGISKDVSPSSNAVDTKGKVEVEYGSSGSGLKPVLGASINSVKGSGGADTESTTVSASCPSAAAGVGWRPSRRALEMSAALHLA
jgi:hypothetical protein